MYICLKVSAVIFFITVLSYYFLNIWSIKRRPEASIMMIQNRLGVSLSSHFLTLLSLFGRRSFRSLGFS